MSEKLTSENIHNDKYDFNPERTDYDNLIIKLKKIKRIIILLEKKINK